MASLDDVVRRLDTLITLQEQTIALLMPDGGDAKMRQRRHRAAKNVLAKLSKTIQPALFLTPEVPKAGPSTSADTACFEEAWKMWAPQPNGTKPEKQKARQRFVTHVKPPEYADFLQAVRRYSITEQVLRGYGKVMANWIPDWRAYRHLIDPGITPEQDGGLVI